MRVSGLGERILAVDGDDEFARTPRGKQVRRASAELLGRGDVVRKMRPGEEYGARLPKLERLDMILETPGDETWDRKNLATVKRLRG